VEKIDLNLKFYDHLLWEMNQGQIVVEGESVVLGVGEEITGDQLERQVLKI
jgi:hypothetical protein